MKTEKKIIKNTAFLTVGKTLGDLCSFFFLVYFARYFGKDILGKYTFAMSIGGLLTVLINFGLNTLMIREVSKDKSKNLKYLGNLLVTQGVFAVITWILIGVIILISNFSNDTKLIVLLIGSYHVFYRFTMLFRSEFEAHEQMHFSAFLEIFHKIVILSLGIVSIIIWKNPIITLSAYPISAFTMFALAFKISVTNYGWPDLKVDVVFIKDSLIKALPFFVIIILAQFYDRIGVILLAYISGETAVGIFSPADRLIVTMTAGVGMFGMATFPVMSRLFTESKDELFKLFERIVRLMLIILLPVGTIIFILSEQIILTAFGDEFIYSVSVLQILVWTLLFFGVNSTLSNLVLVTNHQNKLVKIRAYIYLGFLLINLIIIPLYSYTGLAYAKLLTQALLFVTTYMYVTRAIHKINIIKMASGPILSCLLTTLTFYLLGNINLWLKLSSAVIVCGLTMFLFKCIQKHDIIFMKKILTRQSELKV